MSIGLSRQMNYVYSLSTVCNLYLPKMYYATGWCKGGGGDLEFSIEDDGNNCFPYPKIHAKGETNGSLLVSLWI